MGETVEVELGDVVVRVTHPERVLWPATGTTKADMIRYYADVAGAVLPHVAGRPVTLHRFPEGVDGPHFFQTRAPPHPPWVRTVTMSMPRSGKVFDAVVLDDVPSLIWAANLTAIDLHPFLGLAGALDRPRALVFDLDPGHPAGRPHACRVALAVREVLEAAGLPALPKVTGGKGIHLHVPLDGSVDYRSSKRFARAVAARLAATHPSAVVDRMPLSARAGRVFVDWSQNDPGKSTIAPYSLHGGTFPTVAAPVTWAEVEGGAASDDPSCLVFGPGEARDRLARIGDPFAGAERSGQRLPALEPGHEASPPPQRA
jgi:bifunctional non-homologous end joining protein LigD